MEKPKIIKKVTYLVDGYAFTSIKQAESFINNDYVRLKIENKLIRINNELKYLFKDVNYPTNDTFFEHLESMMVEKRKLTIELEKYKNTK